MSTWPYIHLPSRGARSWRGARCAGARWAARWPAAPSTPCPHQTPTPYTLHFTLTLHTTYYTQHTILHTAHFTPHTTHHTLWKMGSPMAGSPVHAMYSPHPYTLHSTPFTQHLMHPAPNTQHPTPYTLPEIPRPCIRSPKPGTVHVLGLHRKHSTLNTKR